MSVVHRVTGFHKVTERLESEADVPGPLVQEARRLAEAPPNFQEAPGAFPLDRKAVHRLSALLKVPMNPDLYDWFIEPVEV